MKPERSSIKLGDVFAPIYSVTDSGRFDFKMLLEGEWVSLAQRIEVRSPIDNSLLATVPSASEREAGQAVESSYMNRNAIRTIPAVKKIEIFQSARELLLQNMDPFVSILVQEAGKPVSNAQGEIKATAERLMC